MRDFSILKKRIFKYIDYKGISKYEFYKKTGISNGVLSQKTGMSEENTLKLLNYYPEINPIWLLTGKGSMLLDSNVSISEPAAVYKKAPVQEKENPHVVVLKEKIALLEKVIKNNEDIIKLQKDRIEKDCIQIEKLKQKVERLKESLEKKNANKKTLGAGTSLPSKLPVNKHSIIPPQAKLQDDKRKRLRK